MKGRRVAMLRTLNKLEAYRALGIFVLLAMAGSEEAMAGGPKTLPRSFYLPVAFRSCENLTGATLFIGDQPVGSLPTERTFVFTYYPNLKRLEPAVTELRVEGVRADDGTPFIGRLAIDPTAISTAEERIELDFEGVMRQLTYRIDVRYEKVRVLIRDASCGDEREIAGTQASLDPPALELGEKP